MRGVESVVKKFNVSRQTRLDAKGEVAVMADRRTSSEANYCRLCRRLAGGNRGEECYKGGLMLGFVCLLI